MTHSSATICRCCGCQQLEPTLNLGQQPLANSYCEVPTELPRYPLVLNVCTNCFHCQLSVVVNPDAMFAHYLYVSGTSRTLREHFRGFAEESLVWASGAAKRVLDLACNDGTLLEAFRAAGCHAVGVDPAANLAELSRHKGFEIIQGYWPACAAEMSERFDIITACNVLAHVSEPRDFLVAALEHLSETGLLILEFPYAGEMLRHREWDTIYHEHLSYFLASPFLRLVESVQATVAHARLVPIHGGSLRVALQTGRRAHHPFFLELVAEEEQGGLLGMEAFQNFAHHVERVCHALQQRCLEEQRAGRKWIAYGASAKGNTLLNRCPLPLSYVVDDNPLKQGRVTPGCHLPIKATATLAAEPDDLCILLLAWNFAEEILSNVRTLRPTRTDYAAVYVPELRIFPL